jgi:hypothetical protein
MKHENIAQWLKAACIAAAVLGATVFLAWAWMYVSGETEFVSGFSFLRWPMALWVCSIGTLCCLSLRQFWDVCGQIANDRSFCKGDVCAMRNISRELGLVSGMTAVLALLQFTLKALPGAVSLHGSLWLPPLLACLFAGVALLSKALSLLLMKAADLQADHDLTV